MASYISSDRRKNPDLRCAFCGKKAEHIHHRIPTCEGGTDTPDNRIAVCFYHHKQAHASQGDWQRWGKKGGQRTSENPFNWLRNLRQFKAWSDEKLQDYVAVRYGFRVLVAA